MREGIDPLLIGVNMNIILFYEHADSGGGRLF